MSGNQCKWNNKNAGNDAKLDHPFIFYRISKWPDKKNSQYKMGKCKPVISIKKKWIIFTHVLHAYQYFLEPSFDRTIKRKMIDNIDKFFFYRYGCKSADEQRDYKKFQPVSDYLFFFIHKKCFVFQSACTKKNYLTPLIIFSSAVI